MRSVGREAEPPRLANVHQGHSEGPTDAPRVARSAEGAGERGALVFKAAVERGSGPADDAVKRGSGPSGDAGKLHGVPSTPDAPSNDGVERGVVPRVKSNTDLGKARHSGRLDAPAGFGSSESRNSRSVPQPITWPAAEAPVQTPLDRSRRRVARVSERLKARATEELKSFPAEQAVAWFLAGVAVALGLLIATT